LRRIPSCANGLPTGDDITSESVAIAIKLKRVTTLAPDRPYSGLAGTLGLEAGEDAAAVAEDSRSRVAARAGSAHVTRFCAA